MFKNVTFDNESSRKIFVAVGVCMISLAGLGVANGSLSLYTVPITETLGVARSAFAIYASISKLTGALIALAFALIYKKVGAKGLCLMAGLGYTLQYICWAFASNIYMVWLGGIFAGIGYTFSGALTYFAILPPWFPKKIGTVSGIAASMSGISSSIVIQIATRWIAGSGYQQALLFEAIIIAALSVGAVLLVKTSPKDPAYGKNAQVETVEDKKKTSNFAFYKRMFTSPATLMCILIFMLIGMVGYPISSIMVPLAETRGFALGVGAAAFSLHYIVLVPGKIGVGILRDKCGIKLITPVLFVLCIATTLIMGFGPESWYISLGVIWGLGTVINQIWPPYLMMDAFGKFYDPGFVGAGLAFYQLGRAIGEPAIHIAYDMTGSYNISIIIWTVGWVLLWILSYVMLKLGRQYQAKRKAELAASGEPVPAES